MNQKTQELVSDKSPDTTASEGLQDKKSLPAAKPKGRPKGIPELARKPRKKFTTEIKRRFLKELEKHGNIKAAAAVVGMSRVTIYAHIQKNEAFADRVEMAKDKALAKMEEEHLARTMGGAETVVYDGEGNIVTRTVKKDTKPIESRLRVLDPERYGKNGGGDTNININIGQSAKAKLAELLKIDLPQEKEVGGEVIDNED